MKVTKCDKCKKETGTVSRLTVNIWYDVNVADDYEPAKYEKQLIRHSYDLCEDCAEKFEEQIRGFGLVERKIL